MFANKSQIVSLVTSAAAFAAIFSLGSAQKAGISDHAHQAVAERVVHDAGLNVAFDAVIEGAACGLVLDAAGTGIDAPATSGC